MPDASFNIDDLIIRYLAGETLPSEDVLLNSWVSESNENLSYFKTFRNLWLATSQITPNIKSLPLLKNSESTGRELADQTLKTRNKVINIVWKAASILIILVLSGIILFRQKANIIVNTKDYLVSVEATLGSRAKTILPDGTSVWLNSGSKLIYGKSYNNQTREVRLVGEAYFDVRTDSSKPFVVKAGTLAIKALGTSFNVKAYPEEFSIITTLVKGKVVIEGKDKEDKDFSVDLKPKQTYTYFSDKRDFAATKTQLLDNKKNDNNESSHLVMENLLMLKMDKVKTELYTSWRDENWVIENQDLETFARLLERRYNVTIELNSESIKKFRFTGTIQRETIEQIMEIIINTMPVKYSLDKGTFVLMEDRKRIQEFYR